MLMRRSKKAESLGGKRMLIPVSRFADGIVVSRFYDLEGNLLGTPEPKV
jgi:hypothetical protein